MALAGLLPEDRFALDVYNDPTLSTGEKLARLQAGMPPANDPTAAPVNDNGLAAIPAGPGLPLGALAQNDGGGGVGNTPDAPPAAVPDVPANMGQGGAAPSVPTGGGGTSQPGNVSENVPDVQAGATAPSAPADVDPSQLAPPPGQGQELINPWAQRQQVVTVGTDEFVPTGQVIRGGYDPVRVEPGAPGEPEFSVSEQAIEEVPDPANPGKTIKTVVPQGLKIEEGKPGPPKVTDLEAEMRAAEGDEEQAGLDRDAAREYSEQATLRKLTQVEEQIKDIEAQRVSQENERIRRLQEKQAQFQKTLDEINNEGNPVDAYYARQDTGDKIGMGIAAFFGALGQAYTGIENPALKRIDAAVQAEINMQKDKRRQKIEGAKTMYDMASQVFDSEAARDAATREAIYASVQRDIERFATFAQTPERRAQAQELLAQVRQRQLAAEMQRKQATEGEVTTSLRFDPKRQVVVNVGPSDKDLENAVYSNGQIVGFAPTGKRTDEVQKLIDPLDHLEEQLNELAAMTEQAKGNLTPAAADDLKKRIASKVNLIGAAMSVAQGQGAMSDDERKRMSESLGNAQAFINFDLDSTPRVRQTLGYFQRKKQTILQNNVRGDPKGRTPYRGGGRMPASMRVRQ